jgi:hypothetical protein
MKTSISVPRVEPCGPGSSRSLRCAQVQAFYRFYRLARMAVPCFGKLGHASRGGGCSLSWRIGGRDSVPMRDKSGALEAGWGGMGWWDGGGSVDGRWGVEKSVGSLGNWQLMMRFCLPTYIHIHMLCGSSTKGCRMYM